jgi:hypothetical protein
VQQLLVFTLTHGLACVMLCAAVWLLLPARYRSPLPWSPLFIFSMAFFVPVLGTVGVVAAIFPALYLPRKRDKQAWQAVGIPSLPYRAQQQLHKPIFADGGLQDAAPCAGPRSASGRAIGDATHARQGSGTDPQTGTGRPER